VSLARTYVKLCDLRDFDDPALLEAIASILPERDARTHVERKVWEFGMLALFLEEVGAMHEGTRALAVGAGNERVLFWLANRLGRVVATDVYGEGGFAGGSADATMLSDPAAFAPYPYREDHLEVRWMDARSLDFPDAYFDVVFSLSSIEHFGAPSDIVAAARELGRVLRPGGHAFLATDAFVARHPLDAAPVDLAVRLATLGRRRRHGTLHRRSALGECLKQSELRAWIVEPSGLDLMQPLALGPPSPESFDNVCRLHRDGSLEPATGECYPHVILQAARSLFTSVALALEKTGMPAPHEAA
jgi:SAM-dependent methyltransferase